MPIRRAVFASIAIALVAPSLTVGANGDAPTADDGAAWRSSVATSSLALSAQGDVVVGGARADPLVVVAFRASTGDVIWSRSGEAFGADPPLLAGEVVVAFNESSRPWPRLAGLAAASGETSWEYPPRRDGPWGLADRRMAADGGLVFASLVSEAGPVEVHAVAAESGERVWSRAHGALWTAHMLAHGGLLVVVEPRVGIEAWDSATGAAAWSWRFDGPIRAIAPAGDDRIVVLVERKGADPPEDAIMALDLASGREEWLTPLGLLAHVGDWGGIVTSTERIIVRGDGNRLVALDAVNGSVAWERPPDGRDHVGSVVHERLLLSLARGGDVDGIDVATGRGLWDARIGPRIGDAAFPTPPVLVGGTLIAVDADGRAHAMDVSASRPVTADIPGPDAFVLFVAVGTLVGIARRVGERSRR